MRICALFHASDKLGLGSHPWTLLTNFAEFGNEVHLIYPRVDLPEHNGIQMHPIDVRCANQKIRRVLIALYSSFYCLKLLRHARFDVIYNRSIQNGILLVLVSKISGVKLVEEFNGIASDEFSSKGGGSAKKSAIRVAEMFVAKNAGGIRAVTDGIKRYLVEGGVRPESIRVIGNGVDTSIFSPRKKELFGKLRGNFTGEEKVVCFIGQFYPWQGLEYLIAAAPMIIKDVPSVKFLVVGDGIMRDSWKAMVSRLGLGDYFFFTGLVPYSDMPRYINMGDVCVVLKKPIKSGYSTLKMFEYLACGKPIVATNTEGFEALSENGAGLVVNPEDASDVAASISRILLDDKLREQMGQNGRELAVEKYSWKKIIVDVEKLCRQTAGVEK